MPLFRTEHNVLTGETVIIQQAAYRNDTGDVVVLDAAEVPGDGYTKFDPTKEQEQEAG